MRKILNEPDNLVNEMCRGIVYAHPELELLEDYKVIKRKKINKEKVSLISGGGSGHEPAHGGFVGQGMLDAAVCGDVFASPSQIQVYQAIKETAGNKGTLLIIKNYSGDMMNFKNGAYLASDDGINVDYIKVADDIAVQDSLYTVGRRGVAGTVFVHKIAGAAAERGYELEEVKRIAQKTADSVKSIGFALSSCTVPAKGTPTFDLGEGEMEYGVGIHGEPGIAREKSVSADELAKRMIDQILDELKMETEVKRVAVLVNGFGASPLQELYLLNYAVNRELLQRGITISKELVGNYMTSIDMAGASISILKLDKELEELLHDPCSAPAWQSAGKCDEICGWKKEVKSEKSDVCYGMETDTSWMNIENERISLKNVIYLVDAMSDCIIRNEVPFCELDSHAGDGDFGMSVAKGFRKLKEEWEAIMQKKNDTIGGFLQDCSMIVMEHCGGASGPIWGSALRMAGKYAENKELLTATEFAEMLDAALNGIKVTGERSFGRGAQIGDKTLIDAFEPCVNCWKEESSKNITIPDIFEQAAHAAVEGARATEQIVARMGRAGTVGERSIGYPDAGAYALGVIFTEIAQHVSGKKA